VSFKFEGNPSISKGVIERTRIGDGRTDRPTDRLRQYITSTNGHGLEDVDGAVGTLLHDIYIQALLHLWCASVKSAHEESDSSADPSHSGMDWPATPSNTDTKLHVGFTTSLRWLKTTAIILYHVTIVRPCDRSNLNTSDSGPSSSDCKMLTSDSNWDPSAKGRKRPSKCND